MFGGADPRYSYYPLFPSPGVPLELSQLRHVDMPLRPDVLLFSSALQPFHKDILGCVAINPGRASRFSKKGTFAVIEVLPETPQGAKAAKGECTPRFSAVSSNRGRCS